MIFRVPVAINDRRGAAHRERQYEAPTGSPHQFEESSAMTVKSLKVLALAALFAAAGAQAQTYPTKPITMIVPFAAGGPTDTVARSIGGAMQKSLGQTVIVEN